MIQNGPESEILTEPRVGFATTGLLENLSFSWKRMFSIFWIFEMGWQRVLYVSKSNEWPRDPNWHCDNLCRGKANPMLSWLDIRSLYHGQEHSLPFMGGIAGRIQWLGCTETIDSFVNEFVIARNCTVRDQGHGTRILDISVKDMSPTYNQISSWQTRYYDSHDQGWQGGSKKRRPEVWLETSFRHNCCGLPVCDLMNVLNHDSMANDTMILRFHSMGVRRSSDLVPALLRPSNQCRPFLLHSDWM